MPFIIHKEHELPPDRVIVMGGQKSEEPSKVMAAAVPIPEEIPNETPPPKRRGRPPKNRETDTNG